MKEKHSKLSEQILTFFDKIRRKFAISDVHVQYQSMITLQVASNFDPKATRNSV